MIPRTVRSVFFPMLALCLCAHAAGPVQSNNPSPQSITGQSKSPEKSKREKPMQSTPTKFNKVTPNLVVADMEKSLTFYRDVLGFSVSQTVPDKAPFIFAWMKRDNADIFLNQNMPPQPGAPDLYAGRPVGGGTLSLYLAMDGIDDLYAKIQQQKVPIVIAMHKEFYGMREFAVHDPDGYLLIFAEQAK
jgi:uncharacterized glyoxalase superfamily protein PhnB